MRTLEPIPQEAWNEIKEEAVTVLKSAISARKVVDIEGPKGLDHPAVPTGRLESGNGKKDDPVDYGIHTVMPLLELKIPFTLDLREVETISRGARDADLDPVLEAAAQIARAEDTIIYQGHKKAKIPGLATTTENKKISWPSEVSQVPDAVTRALLTLQNKNIDGPYTLVLSEDKWSQIHTMTGNYPMKKQIHEIIDGDIVLNKNTKDSLLISERGGDFIFTIGQDISLGYDYQEQEDLKLYLLESFSFMIAEPRANIVFN